MELLLGCLSRKTALESTSRRSLASEVWRFATRLA